MMKEIENPMEIEGGGGGGEEVEEELVWFWLELSKYNSVELPLCFVCEVFRIRDKRWYLEAGLLNIS